MSELWDVTHCGYGSGEGGGSGSGRDHRNRLCAAGRECRAASERTAGDALSFPTAVVSFGLCCFRCRFISCIARVSYALFRIVYIYFGRYPCSYDRVLSCTLNNFFSLSSAREFRCRNRLFRIARFSIENRKS